MLMSPFVYGMIRMCPGTVGYRTYVPGIIPYVSVFMSDLKSRNVQDVTGFVKNCMKQCVYTVIYGA